MRKIFLFFTLVYCFGTLFSQAGSLDMSFNTADKGFGMGVDDSLYSMISQPDGKIIIGGFFKNFNGVSVNYIARLNADRTLDTTFNAGGTGANGSISDMALQTDGKIIISGTFSSYNGVAKKYIARLNADGTLDTSFDPGMGPNSSSPRLLSLPDGKIFIVGYFTTYNGIARSHIARLNANGDLDTSFNPGTGTDQSISSVVLQSNGKLLIVGGFTTYNGTIRNRIASLNMDGTLDNTFNVGSGADQYINAAVVQPDGKIIIGGDFSSYNNATKNKIARLNTDGKLDLTFTSSANKPVSGLYLESDGKILAKGTFTSFNGVNKNRIVRLNINGTLDTSFDTGSNATNIDNEYISCLNMMPDGKILIGGGFKTFNGIPRNYMAILESNGSLNNFNPNNGANNEVNSIALQPDNKIIIGGKFTAFNDAVRSKIVRLDEDGALDTSFNIGTGIYNGYVYSVKLQSDGKILVGGQFSAYNGVNRMNIVRLNANGSLDTTFNSGFSSTASQNYVTDIVVQPDGKILIGGYFDSYSGASRGGVARLNTDGTLDTSFNPGLSFTQGTNIALQPDGKILICGSRYYPLGNYIVRLNSNGSLDANFSQGQIAYGNYLKYIALQSDGKILLGGSFSSYQGFNKNSLVRLNSNGTLDNSFNSGLSVGDAVYSIKVKPNDKILIGGLFSSYNGVNAKNIAYLDANGSLDTGFNSGTGTDAAINYIALQYDEKVLIGGNFISYNGIGKNRIARLQGGPDLGNNEVINRKLYFYPNPVKDILNVISDKEIYKVVINDISGRTVLESSLGKENKINLQFLLKGSYTITLFTKKTSSTYKFIKE